MARERPRSARAVIVFPTLALIAIVVGLTLLLLRLPPIQRIRPRRIEAVAEHELAAAWGRPPGIRGWLSAVNNDHVGVFFLGATFFFFALAGLDSTALRTQLIAPEAGIVEPDKFNQLFTTHGTAMMFLFAVPMLEALAIYALPLMLGSRDMPFPRMSAFTIWTFIFGGLLFYASALPDVVNFVWPGELLPDLVPDVGWFAYPPLASREFSPGLNVDFYLLGLGFAEFAGIAAAIEIIVSVLKMRAPGMSLDKMPLFAWSVLVMAFAILFAFPAVIVGTTYLELERKFGMPFFDPARGGDPLLWQHLFWFFGHPEVYIMLIPATGIVSMIVPAFAKRPIAGYAFIATAIVATGAMSFGLWIHHMFTVGLPLVAAGLFGAASMMITFPSGVQVFAWIATLWGARRIVFATPMLFVLGFLVTFVAGGITGVMVASVPFDEQAHDTYFVVAHFHYVLAGGVLFPILGGLWYWWPKIAGKVPSETIGRWSFWTIFVGFNLAFLPQHQAGLLGMPRRVFTYTDPALWPWNLASTLGTYVMLVGLVVYGWALVRSLRDSRPAPADPWGAGTLEWATASGAPSFSHRDLPAVTSREPLRDGPIRRWKPERTRVIPEGRLWKESLAVTMFDARPQSIVILGEASIVPLALAVTFTIVSAGLLFEIYTVALVFSALSVPLVIQWLWPTKDEREYSTAGATLGGADLPVFATGTAAVGWWAMALTVLTLAVTLALAVFSYFYLVYAGPDTPPLRQPPVAFALASAALFGASVVPARLALRAIRRGDGSGLRAWLAVALALGATSVGMLSIDLLGLGLRPHEHAYEAMFATFAGYQIGLALVAIASVVLVLIQAWLGYFDARRHLAVENVVMLWAFIAVSAIVTVATLYVSPHVLRAGTG